MLRRPRNGLLSSSGNGTLGSLSAPRSIVRITTGWPRIASATAEYAVVCSSSVGSSSRARNRNSVRYRPMPSAPRFWHCSTSYGKLDVAQQLDPHAVGRLGRQVAELFQLGRVRPVLHDLVPIAGERLLVGMQDHQALVAVDDRRLAAGDVGQKRPDADDRRNAQRLGHDRRVAARPADLRDEALARYFGLRFAVSLGVRLWASTSTSAS